MKMIFTTTFSLTYFLTENIFCLGIFFDVAVSGPGVYAGCKGFDADMKVVPIFSQPRAPETLLLQSRQESICEKSYVG
jgi:hypothetical protein